MRLRFDFAAGPSPLVFDTPERVIVAHRVDEVLPAMHEVEASLRAGFYVAGMVAYEAASAFDNALTTRAPSGIPLLWFGVFDGPRPADDVAPAGDMGDPTMWTPDITVERHRDGIAAVREAIAAGDSYQSNYTFRLHAHVDPSESTALYSRLVHDQRPPYAAFLDIGAWQLLSLSPELFFRIHRGRIATRPMKGTAARGRWDEEDAAQMTWLAQSEKNRAENVMIVDLSRNDIGRIAEVGTVTADELFVVERYPSLFQMVSEVDGQLRRDVTLLDVFSALFPAGSVTGAPKTSSMRLIAGIEDAPRGAYCGAIGYATPDGEAVFNVAIRTAVIETATGRAVYGVGGGITWDSAPADEYAEAIAKSACLTPRPSFDLIETMRFDGDQYIRRDRHEARIRRSATYFDVALDPAALSRALDEHAARHRGTVRRVRLRVDAAGIAFVESQPYAPFGPGPHAVTLASSPVSASDPFLFHKTTRREVYERQRAAHAGGIDVLLWNEAGELTEFTIGNVVVEIDGTRWTPARASGLLAGIFREALLESGEIQERVIAVGELAAASRMWLINSLREWVDVELA